MKLCQKYRRYHILKYGHDGINLMYSAELLLDHSHWQ